MEDFIFIAAEAGDTKTFDFEPSLFHHPIHLGTKRPQGWRWYSVIHPKHKRVVASLYLNIDGEIASSSIKSPFGTVECSDNLPAEILYRFLGFVEGSASSLGVKKIIIKNPPLHYDLEKGALLQVFLLNHGYTLIGAEVGTVRYTTNDFKDELNRLERRKLKKSDEANLSYKLLPNERKYEVYTFIYACRQRKGYALSMTFEDLQRTMNQFPDRYLLFGVFHGEEMIAASVAVRVTSNVLYCFYADHAEAYYKLSPVVLLVKALYEYCQQHGISILDFGTSAVSGKPNFGLLNFKMRLGGKPSPKLTFEKTLSP